MIISGLFVLVIIFIILGKWLFFCDRGFKMDSIRTILPLAGLLGIFTLYTNTVSSFLFTNVYGDVAEDWQLDFQDPATPIMEGIINLHHDLCFFLIIICVFVLWVLLRTLVLFDRSKNKVPSKVVHGTLLEIVWTIVPSFVLLAVAIPSFALLYAVDECADPAVTIKVIGHQWFWSYQYSDIVAEYSNMGFGFDSVMVPDSELEMGQLRLLEVDNRLIVPTHTHIRFLITSADVLHCWAVPSLGVKLDACPGRLNQASVFIKREGLFYGQCSEICGVNHAFMPIVVQAVPLDEYVSWLNHIFSVLRDL